LGFWYGCAGTNTDYVPIDPNTQMDAGTTLDVDLAGCVKSPDEDLPDDNFADTNCDGIDGDISRAIFAAPEGDDANLGTPESPVKSIAQALQLAAQANQGQPQLIKVAIYLSKGDYPEASTVALSSGVNIYGGYDKNNRWTRSNTNVSTILGRPTALTAVSINKETHLELIQIKAAAGVLSGQSSYGMLVRNSPGPIIIRNSRIEAGDGAKGLDGRNGTKGADGGNGSLGQDGLKNNQSATTGAGGAGGISSCSRGGGTGGVGGFDSPGGKGGDGVGNVDSGGAPGSQAYLCGLNGGDGGTGLPGVRGQDGKTGTAAPTTGTASLTGYTPANGGSGIVGTSGTGGGGGGGGGDGEGVGFFCYTDEGAGGGGGGAGGCAATPGTGGDGGGASVGIYAYNSTMMLIQTDVLSGRGGNGANG